MDWVKHSNPFKSRLSGNPTRDPRIAITFETYTPESIEVGDAEDRGWIDEEGVSIEPDEDETLGEVAAEFLYREGATEPSSSYFHKGIWYTAYGDADFAGVIESRSFHLRGFTLKEERDTYDELKRKLR